LAEKKSRLGISEATVAQKKRKEKMHEPILKDLVMAPHGMYVIPSA
jgi:hypothetical protein